MEVAEFGNYKQRVKELEADLTRLKGENEELRERLIGKFRSIRDAGERDYNRTKEISRYREALEKSVKLQSHYAGLLNMYDEGKRIRFESAQAWLDRLEALKGKEQE